MHIDQLTVGNWTEAEALEAAELHFNAPVQLDSTGVVIVNRGGAVDDEYGWTPALDSDVDAILAIKI